MRLKADMSASSKELYEAYQIYCTENNLPALKPRSFSEALIACQSRYNLEYCNNVTNAAGRRVRGFLGIEVLVRNHISVFSGDSMRTYRKMCRKNGGVNTGAPAEPCKAVPLGKGRAAERVSFRLWPEAKDVELVRTLYVRFD